VQRATVASLLMALSACQCAQLREDLAYRCAGDADCPSGVCADGWCMPTPGDGGGERDGGLDAGADAGLDAGADGGVIPCPTWDCVLSAWPQPSPVTNALTVTTFPVPQEIDAGIYAYFGGVLLPDGRVLAIPHTADWALMIDPVNQTAERFGPQLPNQVEGERKWAGGVLGPDGLVYAIPYQRERLLRFDPSDGGAELVGPTLDWSKTWGPGLVGGVVDRHGTIWAASESHEALPLFRFQPDGGAWATFQSPDGGAWGGWWGLSRLPDDRLIAFPKEGANPALTDLSASVLLIDPSQALDGARFVEVAGFDAKDGGLGLQGSALTREGRVWSVAAGADERALSFDPQGAQLDEVRTGATNGFGFLGTFGDGQVWSSPDDSLQTLRLWRFAGDGGFSQLQANTAIPRYGYLGLVATPVGLVAIPGGAREVLLLKPGVPFGEGLHDVRPMSVLLSPYFNKL
jgi:hypothetical protein